MSIPNNNTNGSSGGDGEAASVTSALNVKTKQQTQSPRHILHDLNNVEQKNFLNSFDLILCDCDGVIWTILGNLPFDTGKILNSLKRAGKAIKFISNNSILSDSEYLEKFAIIGAENVTAADVVHPVKAMAYYLNKNKPGKRVFSLCSDAGNETLKSLGVTDIETLKLPGELDMKAMFPLILPQSKISAVLLDININLNYAQLARAYQYLKQDDCIFIAGGTDTHFNLTPDLWVQGFSDFVNHLSNYSKKPAISVGKPSPILGDILKETFDIKQPARCLFIGDSLYADIGFGNSCGFQTLFVLSGETSQVEFLAAKDERIPDFYADSLADFVELFKNIQKIETDGAETSIVNEADTHL